METASGGENSRFSTFFRNFRPTMISFRTKIPTQPQAGAQSGPGRPRSVRTKSCQKSGVFGSDLITDYRGSSVTQLNDRQESPLVQALVRTLITTRDQSSVPPSFLLLSADLKKTVRSRTVGQSSPDLLPRISQQHKILPESAFSPRLRPFPFLCVTMEGLGPLKICRRSVVRHTIGPPVITMDHPCITPNVMNRLREIEASSRVCWS